MPLDQVERLFGGMFGTLELALESRRRLLEAAHRGERLSTMERVTQMTIGADRGVGLIERE